MILYPKRLSIQKVYEGDRDYVREEFNTGIKWSWVGEANWYECSELESKDLEAKYKELINKLK